MSKSPVKSIKIANTDEGESPYILNDMRNFNEVFRKDVTYDNIKIHKKTGVQLLFRRCI